jgi:hypothetical protein
LLVDDLEKLVISYGLHQFDCAVALNAGGQLEMDAMADYIRRLLVTTEMHKSAYEAAQLVAARPVTSPKKTILDACQLALG